MFTVVAACCNKAFRAGACHNPLAIDGVYDSAVKIAKTRVPCLADVLTMFINTGKLRWAIYVHSTFKLRGSHS